MSENRSIDLHNCTVDEAIREFVRFYNCCVRAGYRGRLEIIHGYGSSGSGGVIRDELRRYLTAHEEIFGEFLAGESLRNPGVTILFPRETLAAMPLGSGTSYPHMQGKRPKSTKPAPKTKTR
jgi:hypothetical protein